MDTTESRSFAARLAELLQHEHHAMADFLVALAEFDRRRGWLALGYANFFDFLVRELGLARGTAHYRKTAAYLVQRYPEVLDALRQGTLCMRTRRWSRSRGPRWPTPRTLPIPSTFPRPWNVRSESGMVDGANGRSTPAGSAGRGSGCSSTTLSRRPAAGSR